MKQHFEEKNKLFQAFILVKSMRELYHSLDKAKINSNQLPDVFVNFNTHFIDAFLLMAEYHNKLDFNTIKDLLTNKSQELHFNGLFIEFKLQSMTNQYVIKYHNEKAILDGINTYHYNKTIFDRFMTYYEDKFKSEREELIKNNKYIQDLIFNNEFEHIIIFFIFIMHLFEE